MRLELKYTPSGVCGNCLNRAHGICDDKDCICMKRKHDDSSWWTDSKTQVVQVKLYYPSVKAGNAVVGHAIAHARLTDSQVIINRLDVEIVSGKIRCGCGGLMKFRRMDGRAIPHYPGNRGWRLEPGPWQLERTQ